MWQVGDIAMCIKAVRPPRSGRHPGYKVGQMFKVVDVSCYVLRSGVQCIFLGDGVAVHRSGKPVRVNSRFFRKIQKADEKFCEQMKQLMKGKIDA